MSHRYLGLTGLLDHFEGRLFSATEVSHGKPAPDLFLHAARTMGWEPSSCVVVEDSSYGVDAALAAGMQAIAYTGGVTRAHRLARPGVTLITDMRPAQCHIRATTRVSPPTPSSRPPHPRDTPHQLRKP